MLFGAEEPRDRARDLLRWHTDPHATSRRARPPVEIEMEHERRQIEESVSSALAALKRPGSEGSAVSYALPANIVRRVTREIIESGTARRGWLGVTVDDRGPGEIIVAEVASNSPAARAGLESGDRVIIVNGQPVEGSWTLMESVASAGPGDAMKIVVMRDGKQVPANVQLGTAPRQQYTWTYTPSPPLPPRPVLGVRVEQPDHEELGRLGAPDGAGMLIAEVHDQSRADQAGLLEGDVIIRALGIPVRSLADLRRALRDQPAGKHMEMVVVRDGHEVNLMVPPPPPPPPAPPAPAPPSAIPRPSKAPRP
jgi:serine protease Do